MVIYPFHNGTAAPTYRDPNSTEGYVEYAADTDDCSVKSLSPQEKGQVALQDMLDNQRDKFNRRKLRCKK